jgi:hypothetical protein
MPIACWQKRPRNLRNDRRHQKDDAPLSSASPALGCAHADLDRQDAEAVTGAYTITKGAAFGPPFGLRDVIVVTVLCEVLCLTRCVGGDWATRSFQDVLSPMAT